MKSQRIDDQLHERVWQWIWRQTATQISVRAWNWAIAIHCELPDRDRVKTLVQDQAKEDCR